MAPNLAISPDLAKPLRRSCMSLLPVLWLRKWPVKAFLNLTLPLPVILTRFNNPLCDFNLDIFRIISKTINP